VSPLNCKTDKKVMTVGEHVRLNCKGEFNPDFLFEKTEFKLAENLKFTLKVINVDSSNTNEFTLDFTIYTPGNYNINELILVDGTNVIYLSGSSIKVKSVIKSSSEGPPPEPFGPILPISLVTPIYYAVLLLVAIIAVGLYTFFKAKRMSFYKKLKTKLKDYNSAISAETQFYKSIRVAEKSEYPLEQIQNAFKLYNARAYQLPLFDLSNETAAKYFKRNFPQYKSTRIQLFRLLEELDELQKNKGILSLQNKHEFVKKLYRYVESNKGVT